MNREDFKLLEDSQTIYFDNGATTLKPKVLALSVSEYYNTYSANAHRGDYDLGSRVDTEYESTRKKIQAWLGAKRSDEIVFTYGTTDAMNKLIFGYFRYHLHKGDEVLLTKSEHASNILPWFELADEIGIVIKYIPLDKHLKVTMEAVKTSITEKTKVISIAHITNVVGDVRPITEITAYAHTKNILVVVDGAQSVPHLSYNVAAMDIDFLTFSAHKMYGPTGVGILYGKYDLLNNIKPISFGGGMNALFNNDGFRIYSELPGLLEAGTQNIAGVIGFGHVIDYLRSIGIDKIQKHELELRKYAVEQLKQIPEVIIYNEESESSIITFNVKDIFAQDLAIYLNKYHICVRAGNHCAKILKDELGIKNTCRMSLAIYNTKEEIDVLVGALKNPNIKLEII